MLNQRRPRLSPRAAEPIVMMMMMIMMNLTSKTGIQNVKSYVNKSKWKVGKISVKVINISVCCIVLFCT
jgi:hypothetical protein